MTETPMPKLVTSMAVPAMASTLITTIYNMADTFFVSQISTSASAAVGVVFAVMSLIQALGGGFGMGAGSIISRKLGEKKDDEANMYASCAFFGALSFGAAILIIGLVFLEPLMRLLGATDTMLPYAKDYARYIFIAAPIMCSSFVLNSVMRSQGKAIMAMVGAEYKNFYLGYSYDFPMSDIAKESSGSHEIILGYKLKLDFSEKNKNKHKSIRIM